MYSKSSSFIAALLIFFTASFLMLIMPGGVLITTDASARIIFPDLDPDDVVNIKVSKIDTGLDGKLDYKIQTITYKNGTVQQFEYFLDGKGYSNMNTLNKTSITLRDKHKYEINYELKSHEYKTKIETFPDGSQIIEYYDKNGLVGVKNTKLRVADGCLDDIDCDGKPDQYDEDMDGDKSKNWEDSDSDGDNITDAIDDKYPQGPGLNNNQSISAYDEYQNSLELIKKCNKDISDLVDELDKEYLDGDYSKGWYVSPQVQKEYYDKLDKIFGMCKDLNEYSNLVYIKYLCSLAGKGNASWNQELLYQQACLEIQKLK